MSANYSGLLGCSKTVKNCTDFIVTPEKFWKQQEYQALNLLLEEMTQKCWLDKTAQTHYIQLLYCFHHCSN